MEILPYFDTATSTLTYLVFDPQTRDAIVIDPVLDYDPGGSTVSYGSVKHLEKEIRSRSLNLWMVLETHVHADHLTGAQYLKKQFPGVLICLGAEIRKVQQLFQRVFGLDSEFTPDGHQFDRLFADMEKVRVGSLEFDVWFTPGHTPACATYYFDKAKTAFTGDALFLPPLGTGRCDFPGGSAEQLYDSVVNRLYSLPEDTTLCPGHDYPAAGNPWQWKSTVKEQRATNSHLKASTSKQEYVAFRTGRDKTLSAPRLLYPSLRVNIEAGRLPESDEASRKFLNIPLFEKA